MLKAQDEAAEREYCIREWSRILKDKQESAVQWLMDQRAAARGEGYEIGYDNGWDDGRTREPD